MSPRLFTYVVQTDSGFSPNPFNGFCTLACCKPMIRRAAQPGDRIIGLTPRRLGFRMTYTMVVSEAMTFGEYWNDPRFAHKRPATEPQSRIEALGDNIYRPEAGGAGYEQIQPAMHDSTDVVRDLGADRVLIGEAFSYFGEDAMPLPPELEFISVGRAHRCRFTAEQIALVEELCAQLEQGAHAPPRSRWPHGDESWLEGTEGAP